MFAQTFPFSTTSFAFHRKMPSSSIETYFILKAERAVAVQKIVVDLVAELHANLEYRFDFLHKLRVPL